MDLQIDLVESEIGRIFVVSDGQKLRALDYEDCEHRMRSLLRTHCGDFRLSSRLDPNGFSTCLRRYLAGNLTAIDDVQVTTKGTAFQRQVWRRLRRIPAGSTMTYGTLAARMGAASAARAVGAANALNPVSIVLPCHRLVGANGDLTGYAGGLARKAWLLAHERKHAARGDN